MKSFKIVFASLMIAALGIVGFSSFKSSNEKVLAQRTFSYSGGVWTEITSDPTSLCGGNGAVCAIQFDDNDISEEDAQELALEFTDFGNHENGAFIPGSQVKLYEKQP